MQTVKISDDLHRKIKKMASERGMAMGKLLEEVFKDYSSKPSSVTSIEDARKLFRDGNIESEYYISRYFR